MVPHSFYYTLLRFVNDNAAKLRARGILRKLYLHVPAAFAILYAESCRRGK